MGKEKFHQRIYKVAYNYLLNLLPKEVSENTLKWYFISNHCDSISEIYERLLWSAQNRQAMPNVIQYYIEWIRKWRREEIKKIIHDYDFDRIITQAPETLLDIFEKYYPITNRQPNWYWNIWCNAIIDWAWFMKNFNTVKDFDAFVKTYNKDVETRRKLAWYIANEIQLGNWHKWIKWLWEALVCDFLKEIGYFEYLKPDVHIKDICYWAWFCWSDDISVFNKMTQIAYDNNITPYHLDKLFWLICSGNFYNQGIKIWSHKKEFIEILKKELWKDYQNIISESNIEDEIQIINKIKENKKTIEKLQKENADLTDKLNKLLLK